MHGGTLRSMQIREALNDQFEELNELEFEYELSVSGLVSALSRISPSLARKWFHGLTLAGLLKLAWLRVQVQRRVEPGGLVFLETCGINSILLGHALLEHGCRIVCFSHNIEALVRDVNTRLVCDAFSWMRFEMGLYKSASAVHTISEFDCAVIACFGVNAKCFPYFPCRSRLTWIESIRARREKYLAGSSLLLFSSVNNPPTRRAVGDFLDDFDASSVLSSQNLIVAGRGTEMFRTRAGERVQVLGEISSGVAESLQVEASLAVIPALQTTGFLTKLVENNLVGLPSLVVGDYLQAEALEKYGVLAIPGLSDLPTVESLFAPNRKAHVLFERPTLNFNQ